MADMKQPNRPLSPHLTIYRPQITSVLSILNRITGIGLGVGAVLIVWWFIAAATGPGSFAFIDGLLTSWLGGLVMIGMAAALWFHFCNGVRHLTWDGGYGLEIDMVQKTGVATLAATGALTLLTLVVAFV